MVKDALADHFRRRSRRRETLWETGLDQRSPEETGDLLLRLDLRAAAAALRAEYDDYDVAAAEQRLERLVMADVSQPARCAWPGGWCRRSSRHWRWWSARWP